MTGPILFEITAADSHQQIILPVIRLLTARGVSSIVYSDCELLRTASDTETLEREGIPHVRMADSPLPAGQPEWEAAAAPFLRRIPAEVDRIRPALVALLNDRNFPSNVYLKTARRMAIPTLLIQESLRKDLFQRPPPAKLFARWRRKIFRGIEEGLRRYGQGGCDAVAAWGDTSRAYFRRVGVPQKQIFVTGNPRFDRLAGADFSADARRIRADLRLAPDDFLLIFLSSPIERMQIVSRAEKQAALGRLLAWAAALRADAEWRNLRMAFKLHRSEDPAPLQALLEEHKAGSWARIVERPLYPLLQGSQAALMFSTTAGIEAALLSVPLGILELSKPLDDWDLAGRGVAERIRSAQELVAFVRVVRGDPQRGARGARAVSCFLANPGRAAQAVADLAARMAGSAACGSRP
ncbi:MAG: hypothetical protein JW929_10935 [Anaerolineales bacterium]|nr:hypothetical protein [Anaerolineales bacterium]